MSQLKRTVEQYGIRTIINLRGRNSGRKWYDEEKKSAAALGVEMHDVNYFSACEMPHRRILLRIIKLLDQSAKPILIHCNGGADRSGLTSATYLLLSNHDLSAARRQFSFKFGYVAIGCKKRMLFLFDDYEEWLTQHAYAHTPSRFRNWAEHVYDPPKEIIFCFPDSASLDID